MPQTKLGQNIPDGAQSLTVAQCVVRPEWTTGMRDHGGSVREDEAQSNGEPTLPPFVFLVPDTVSSQLAW